MDTATTTMQTLTSRGVIKKRRTAKVHEEVQAIPTTTYSSDSSSSDSSSSDSSSQSSSDSEGSSSSPLRSVPSSLASKPVTKSTKIWPHSGHDLTAADASSSTGQVLVTADAQRLWRTAHRLFATKPKETVEKVYNAVKDIEKHHLLNRYVKACLKDGSSCSKTPGSGHAEDDFAAQCVKWGKQRNTRQAWATVLNDAREAATVPALEAMAVDVVDATMWGSPDRWAAVRALDSKKEKLQEDRKSARPLAEFFFKYFVHQIWHQQLDLGKNGLGRAEIKAAKGMLSNLPSEQDAYRRSTAKLRAGPMPTGMKLPDLTWRISGSTTAQNRLPKPGERNAENLCFSMERAAAAAKLPKRKVFRP